MALSAVLQGLDDAVEEGARDQVVVRQAVAPVRKRPQLEDKHSNDNKYVTKHVPLGPLPI